MIADEYYQEEPTSASRQVDGTHYLAMAVQPWDALRAWPTDEQLIGYHLGTTIAYLARFNAAGIGKGGLVDLRKAHHVLGQLIEEIEARGED